MSVTNEIEINQEIRPYLEEISERLWSGHAAVMVGAGFSMNAENIVGSDNSFPSWSTLGDNFYKKIHGVYPENEKYLNAIKLAEEVNAAFGRSVLNQMLRDLIPDLDHKPSQLYTKLLKLGWADVFTTNYDTLLERAKDEITDRSYQVVIRKEDLVNSTSPRIIKLHGSFPSNNPFIITEEDYRLYPKDYASFVNTVQQSLLEKTLCLIGFSGDDPNFLKWTGWIRDNLGSDNSPKIYLIGIFDISDAQKKLLEKRNIILVDFKNSQGIDGNHYKALERFFEFLQSKKSEENRLDWPDINGSRSPDLNAKKNKSELTNIVNQWKHERERFPGWVIVPEDRRDVLWAYTNHWEGYFNVNSEYDEYDDISFLYELCWRIDKCLLPLSDNLAEIIEIILDKYAPFSEVNKERLIVDDKDHNYICWNKIKQEWINLSLFMLKYYRIEGNHDKWNELSLVLDKLKLYLSEEHIALFYYEKSLCCLFMLDTSELNSLLEEWPDNPDLPFHEAKRAGLLAEIGDLIKSERILSRSLAAIRKKQNLKPVTIDYTSVSEESYVMLLLQGVQQAVLVTNGDWSEIPELRNEYTERWNILSQYKTNPWSEIKNFNALLDKPFIQRSDTSKCYKYDIGEVTKTYHLHGADQEQLNAYSFLCFSETIGVPFRLPGIDFLKKQAHGCLSRIEKNSPYWALITLIRLGDSKSTDQLFSRESVFRLEFSSVDIYARTYLKVLTETSPDLEKSIGHYVDNMAMVFAKVIPEIISRLCTKMSFGIKLETVDFIVKLYSSTNIKKYDGVDNLLKRLIVSLNHDQFHEVIKKLLYVPIPANYNDLMERDIKNPFDYIDDKHKSIKTKILNAERIEYFINNSKSDNPSVRKWALTTLIKLFDLNLLTATQKISLGDSIWRIKDGEGFPKNINLYKFAWLRLPHPKDITPYSLILNYINHNDLFSNNDSLTVLIKNSLQNIHFMNEVIWLHAHKELDQGVKLKLIDYLVSWWGSNKEDLLNKKGNGLHSISYSETSEAYYYFILTISSVISKDLETYTDKVKEKIILLIDDVESCGLPSLKARVATVTLRSNTYDSLNSEIYKSLLSRDIEYVTDSLRAIFDIAQNSHSAFKNVDVEYAIALVAQTISSQKQPGLVSSINTIIRIIKELPELFIPSLENMVLLGLSITIENTSLTTSCELMSFDEKAQIRQTAAELAYVLYEYYSNLKVDIPGELRQWETICNDKNEFSEIRKQWRKS